MTDRRAPSATDLWKLAREAGDRSHQSTAVRLCLRALRRVESDPTAGPEVRAQILVTLACYQSELGKPADALALLDEASAVDPSSEAAVLTARGMVLLRSGDPGAAVALDRAIEALSGVTTVTARPGAGPSDLASALLNRGLLHMMDGRLQQAQRDTEAAERAARESARPGVVLMARHNLGYVTFLSGDLPGALQAMSTAAAILPDAKHGVQAMDRAKVLLSAGLLAEAEEFTDEALEAFRVNRAIPDLAEACLVKAELRLLNRNGSSARTFARRAVRIYRHRGNVPATLTSRLLALRADAAVRASRRTDVRPHDQRRLAADRRRATANAAEAAALSVELGAVGLADQAGIADLFAAEALLDAGDVAGAEIKVKAVTIDRSAPLATRLHRRLVAGRIELAAGRRSTGLTEIRRGLDDLVDFQARFGSQDLQSAASIHGRDLANLGLRTAASTGSPAAILEWLERSRAASTRLPAVRPPADPVLAEELGALRVADEQARAALLAGKRDPAADRRVAELRRRVRARSWTVSGSGRADRPPSLTAVRRLLAQRRPDAGVVALFLLGGKIHALVISPHRAAHLVLAERAVVEGYRHRLQSDLDLLADERIPARLAKVAAGSMAASLGRLSDAFAPVLEVIGSGPLLIAAVGELATVPWMLLPCMDNRPVTVSSSVTRAVAGLGQTADLAAEHGVLVVAGPDVTNGDKEASAIARLHRNALLLTGQEATGRAVLDAIPSGGLMHVAAHGHHERGNPLFSGVKLADGLLFGYDFAPNPSLPGQVVLSSCDVGQTDERPGGEPLGLVAALVRSGVPTVITGTSMIADSVAEVTMVGYHELLLSGAAPAEALAAAVAAARAATGLPAPFSCFGAGL
jgi:tetratricopeptide (TPR) repeat protein